MLLSLSSSLVREKKIIFYLWINCAAKKKTSNYAKQKLIKIKIISLKAKKFIYYEKYSTHLYIISKVSIWDE